MDDTTILKMFSIDNLPIVYDKYKAIEEQIVKLSSINHWWSDNSYKYSLVKCGKVMDTYVYGWLTQEYQIKQHLYDENKTESSNEVESFEDRFFILCLNKSILAIEWKKFIQRNPLSPELMIQRMQRILNEVISEFDYCEEISLEQIPVIKTTKEEFISIFYSNRILKINIDNYGMDDIPDDVILVNPVPGLEGAMREIANHDVIHPSIAKLNAEANPNGNLNKSAIIRTSIHSGDPTRIEYTTPDSNKIRVRKKHEKGEVEVEIPVRDRDSAAKRIQMVTSAIEALEDRDNDNIFPKQKSILNQQSLFNFKEE